MPGSPESPPAPNLPCREGTYRQQVTNTHARAHTHTHTQKRHHHHHHHHHHLWLLVGHTSTKQARPEVVEWRDSLLTWEAQGRGAWETHAAVGRPPRWLAFAASEAGADIKNCHTHIQPRSFVEGICTVARKAAHWQPGPQRSQGGILNRLTYSISGYPYCTHDCSATELVAPVVEGRSARASDRSSGECVRVRGKHAHKHQHTYFAGKRQRGRPALWQTRCQMPR